MSVIPAAQGPDSFIWWDWIGRHTDELWQKTLEHIYLTSIAIGIGTVISVVLSIVALRFRRTMAPITWAAGVLYAIPSLALFGFLVPITGATVLTAEIALVSYCLLVLIQNLIAGIDGVAESVKDAADGMGYTRAQRFIRIEVPLALPEFIIGLRVATVTVIGLVTVAALVGHGGLGDFINDGLQRNFSTPIVLGVVASIVLALVADACFVILLRLIAPWTRKVRP